jgi:hypothetical protein
MKALYALVGMKHRGTESVVAALKDGHPVTLIREPNNDYDPNAVQVWADQHIGYVKATQARPLAMAMDRALKATRAGVLRKTADKWPMIEVEE